MCCLQERWRVGLQGVVVGLYREDEALRLLLEGTGLNYRAEDATTVVGVQSKDTVSVTESIADRLR